MHSALRRNLLFVALVFMISTHAVAQIVSDFASSADGWTIFITSTGTSVAPTYTATGGNPANSGEISYSTGSVAVGFYFTAPAKFKGDLSAAYNQPFSFDIHTSYPGNDNSIGDVIITNSAASASLYYQLPGKPPYMGYFGSTYTLQLIETFTGWHYGSMTGPTPTAAQMKLVLGNVTNLQIRSKYYASNTFNIIGYLDNVSVGIAPPTVTTQPTTPQTVCAGPNVTLSTLATGNPNITYRWQLLNTSTGVYADLNNNAVYSSVATSSMLINTTGTAGAGTYRCRISGSYVADIYSNTAVVNVNAKPAAPSTTGAPGCNPSSVTLSASGASNGQYRWYTVATGGTAIASQNNSTYSTPSLTTTTIYYVAINNGTCESNRTAVTATINNPPAAPGTSGGSSCGTGTVTLTASGAAAGQYRWYTVATAGTAITGQTNATYTTPSLSTTTNYYAAINNGTCQSTRTLAIATITTPPTAPITTGSSSCSASTLTLTATGGTNGQYRWYTVATNGTAIASQTNSTYATPSLATTTNYYVAINNGTCESARTPVTATINTPPNAPTTTGNFTCTIASVTLTAAGGTAGQYRWYTVATGGTAIAGQTNSTYATPSIAATTTYYVAINNGTCESNRTAVTATLGGASCPANEPPVIAPTPISAPIEGKVTLSLANLISDKDNNLDLSTLKVTVPPSSGASATIDSQSNLILDYTGISFSGTEKLTIQVCDLAGACTQRELSIDVIGDIKIYNAVSPNNDGKNEFLFLQYIDVLADTKKNKVSIFGRWGDVVFDVADYDNLTKVFKGLNNNGNELPNGTYFYKIEFTGNRKAVTGFLTLKR